MLIEDLKPELIWESGCCAQWRSAVAELPVAISDTLPKLGKTIKDTVYESVQNTLRLKKGERSIYVYPKKIYIPYIDNEERSGCWWIGTER